MGNTNETTSQEVVTEKIQKDTKKSNLTPTQLAMIEALRAQLGNVTAAVAEVGILRNNHYRWMRENEEYAQAVNNVDELVLDFAESSLHKQIMKNNTPATIFFLKTKGKKRGYIERQEVALSGGIADFVQSFSDKYADSVSKKSD